MADSDKNLPENVEKVKDAESSSAEHMKPEEENFSEAKISVGIEAGEIIESLGLPTGEVSEKEQKGKEKDTGKSGIAKAKALKKQIKPPPSIPKMKSQVRSQLKKEIRQLNKKINKVIRKRDGFEPYKLNKLVKKLRKLKELLSTLAYATTEMIKDLWTKHVKEN